MLIIIEGADKTGKTTLARAIEKKFGFSYAHFGAPGPDPAGDYANFLINLKKPTVCDRFYIGEQVYGPLLRGRSIITSLQKTVIERMCRLRGAILIWANTPLNIAQERLHESKEEDVTLTQNAKAWNMFKSIIPECNILPRCVYDSSIPGAIENILEEISPVVHTMKAMAGLAHIYCTGLGTMMGPKLVIVGESLNEKATWIGKPFDGGSSSEFLNDVLRQAEVLEIMTYICNADKLSKEEAMFIRQSGIVPWLALGDKASDRLKQLDIMHVRIPHPQFWKRFHATEKERYVNFVKEWLATCKEVKHARV